jgi:hypothetical protein
VVTKSTSLKVHAFKLCCCCIHNFNRGLQFVSSTFYKVGFRFRRFYIQSGCACSVFFPRAHLPPWLFRQDISGTLNWLDWFSIQVRGMSDPASLSDTLAFHNVRLVSSCANCLYHSSTLHFPNSSPTFSMELSTPYGHYMPPHLLSTEFRGKCRHRHEHCFRATQSATV